MGTTLPPCPICEVPVEGWREHPDANSYDCPNCGRFLISGSALAVLGDRLDREKAVLSHQVWRNQPIEGAAVYEVTTRHLRDLDKYDFPDPSEQIDLLIAFWGRQQKDSPGVLITQNPGNLRAKIGAMTEDDVLFIFNSASERGLIKPDEEDATFCDGKLTIRGWQRFRSIERGGIKSHTAFMAMPFGNELVAKTVDEVFRPAVAETGFRLKRVDDELPAGLIDDRIRIGIRLCRFLIADLTGGNQGAYWEAGYAEGLGKPVIYTCSKAHFDEYKTHFDTNHCTTVIWDPDGPEQSAASLKATIRATLPFEAKMPEDPAP